MSSTSATGAPIGAGINSLADYKHNYIMADSLLWLDAHHGRKSREIRTLAKYQKLVRQPDEWFSRNYQEYWGTVRES
jgi:hypothetical protein